MEDKEFDNTRLIILSCYAFWFCIPFVVFLKRGKSKGFKCHLFVSSIYALLCILGIIIFFHTTISVVVSQVLVAIGLLVGCIGVSRAVIAKVL